MKNKVIRILTGLVVLGLAFSMPLVLSSCFEELFGPPNPDNNWQGPSIDHRRSETKRLANKYWLLTEWNESFVGIDKTSGDTVYFETVSYNGEDVVENINGEIYTRQGYTRWMVFGNTKVSASGRGGASVGVSWNNCQYSIPENDQYFDFDFMKLTWGWSPLPNPTMVIYDGGRNPIRYSHLETWQVNSLTDERLILSEVYRSLNLFYTDDEPANIFVHNRRSLAGGVDAPPCENCDLYYDGLIVYEAVENLPCGEECEEELACENGGTFNSITCGCNCPEGFTGELCETPIGACSSNTPCINGTVVSNASGDGCDCECDEGWYGFACSETNAFVSTVAGGFQGNLDGTGNNAQFYAPIGVDLAGNGDLIIADANNHRIRRMTQDGMVTTVAGISSGYVDSTSAEARFSLPIDVAVDNQGNIYVADRNNHCIRLTTTDGQVTTLAGNGTIGIATDGMIGAPNTPTFAYPKAIALDAAEEWLYVVDNSYRIMRMKVTNLPAERVIEIVAGVAQNPGFNDGPADQARFEQCSDITLDPEGNIYVADERNNAVRLINQNDGTVTTIAGNPPTVQNPINLPGNDKFDRIGGIAWTPGGIYLTDLRNHRIRVLQPFDDGVWVAANIAGDFEFNNSGMAGNNSGFSDGLGNEARFDEPYGVVVDALGNLYVSDSKNHAIRHVRIGN